MNVLEVQIHGFGDAGPEEGARTVAVVMLKGETIISEPHRARAITDNATLVKTIRALAHWIKELQAERDSLVEQFTS